MNSSFQTNEILGSLGAKPTHTFEQFSAEEREGDANHTGDGFGIVANWFHVPSYPCGAIKLRDHAVQVTVRKDSVACLAPAVSVSKGDWRIDSCC